MAKRKKKRGRGGIIAVLIAGVVAAGYFLRDCLPNWGMGGGGSGEASADKDTPEDQETQPEGEKGTVAVTVKGEECAMGEEVGACADRCAEIKDAHSPEDSRVEIDSTRGAHSVVEEFKKCLTDAGFSVQVKSE